MGEDIHTWIAGIFKPEDYPPQTTSVVLYNDELPIHQWVGTGNAHSKGILVWSEKKIGWLIHSVPGWPQQWPCNQIDQGHLLYGQSFVFLESEFSQKRLDEILSQLLVMEVKAYLAPEAYRVAFTYHSHKKETDPKQEIKTLCLTSSIQHVAKSRKWGKDLFEDYLVATFESQVLCQTWMKPGIPSSALVKNVKLLRWKNGVEYQTSCDHSKYAISMNPDHKWVWIGDINRMESQARRGGGGLMIQDEGLWRAFHRIMVNYTEIIPNPHHVAEEAPGCGTACMACCLGCLLFPCVPCIRCLRWAVED